MKFFCHFIFAIVISTTVYATDIEGVQPAALDQPRVHMHLRREAKGAALVAEVLGEKTINITAFLDTGASGIMLSGTTAEALGVKAALHEGKEIEFTDIGVGGGEKFGVSESLFVFLAPTRPAGEPEAADGYPISLGPVRMQLSHSGGLIQMLTGGLDVVGMPAMKGKIVILDPKPVDTFGDTMRSGVFAANEKKIPKTDRHIKLTYESFKRFTTTSPENAEGPTLSENPLIDGIKIARGEKTSSGKFLLDTGAAASMISLKQAEKLGVKYAAGTQKTDSPKLEGIPDKEQFTITIGGVGGATKAAGFFLDSLSVPTAENDPLVYKPAPVLVFDISVEDPMTHEKMTLDGIFGMNYLVASALLTESGLMPDIGKLTKGPFEWIIFDEPKATLGVKLKR